MGMVIMMFFVGVVCLLCNNKYACRKTLADNRPRIRGRFARNDETGEIPKAACSAIDEDDDELWVCFTLHVFVSFSYI